MVVVLAMPWWWCLVSYHAAAHQLGSPNAASSALSLELAAYVTNSTRMFLNAP